MMSMVRLNVPVFMYGGSILPGRFHGRDVTVATFEAVGQHSAGNCERRPAELECVACPPPVPAAAFTPRWPASPRPGLRCGFRRACAMRASHEYAEGRAARSCISRYHDPPPDIVTRVAENAAHVAVTGGLTPAVASAAIAHEAGIDFDLMEVAEIFKKTLHH